LYNPIIAVSARLAGEVLCIVYKGKKMAALWLLPFAVIALLVMRFTSSYSPTLWLPVTIVVSAVAWLLLLLLLPVARYFF
jgi:hypothetical protein